MIFLPTNLRCLREKKGLTQSMLAEKLGVRPNTISNYEKGNSSPDFKLLGIIIEILEVDAHTFLYTDLRGEELPQKKFRENADGRGRTTKDTSGLRAAEDCSDVRDDQLNEMREELRGIRESIHVLFEGIQGDFAKILSLFPAEPIDKQTVGTSTSSSNRR